MTRLLRAKDHVRMPWKNSGGVTTEIAIHPAGATLANFGWRVSMADVAQNGPFSTFEGIDRSLAVLEGNGIRLAVGDAAPRVLTVETAPFSFRADVPAHADLIDGPIRDLNVMTRRGSWRHTVERLSLADRSRLAFETPYWLLFCHRGKIEIDSTAGLMILTPGDALLGEGACALPIDAAQSVAFRVDLGSQ